MAEQRRVDGIRSQIDNIKRWPSSCVGMKAAQVADVLAQLTSRLIGEDFAEFQDEAREALQLAIAQVESMHAGAVAQEAEAERIKAERAELAKLRADAEAREREEREAMEAERRASRAQIEEEQRQARLAQAAEDQRLAAERARLDAERRAAEEARREVARKEAELLDARQMLHVFVTRFGHLDEFQGVVGAIKALKAAKRKAA